MRWSARQRAMLAEMGLRLGPAEASPASASGASRGPSPPPAPQPTRQAPPPAALPPAAPLSAASVRPSPKVAPVPAPATSVALRPAGVAAMDWAALREAVAACTACALCKTRRQPVFGVGEPQAPVMVIGEAPGEQEDRQGEPFVGKSGQLLDRMLEAIGLARAPALGQRPVFITNVLKCRPPMNRNPSPEEVVQCEPFLRRQVELVRPGLILAFGKFAIESVLRTQEPVGRLRGRVHDYAGVPVVVSYHPAFLLRQPLEKARAWEDLCLARELLQRGPGAG